jgi:hypothetical protein
MENILELCALRMRLNNVRQRRNCIGLMLENWISKKIKHQGSPCHGKNITAS